MYLYPDFSINSARSLGVSSQQSPIPIFNHPLLFPPDFGALPAPLPLLVLGLPCDPPSSSPLALLTSGLPGLTFNEPCLPLSCSFCFSAPSGLVVLGSKAAPEPEAASSSADLEYSDDWGLSESLSCVSLRACTDDVEERKRGRARAVGR